MLLSLSLLQRTHIISSLWIVADLLYSSPHSRQQPTAAIAVSSHHERRSSELGLALPLPHGSESNSAMLRRKVGGEAAAAAAEVARRPTKVRKRCALSSSSPSGASAGPRRKLRLKRRVAVVVVIGRRGGAASPPHSSRNMSESSWNRRCADGMMHSSSSLSARELVNAAWQLSEQEGLGTAAKDAAAGAHRRCASAVEMPKRSRTKSIKAQLDADEEWLFINGAGREVHTCAQEWTGLEDRMTHLHDMYDSLTASKELARVLATVWGRKNLDPSTASLLSALRSELDVARAHARQLVEEQTRRGDEIESLKKRLAEEARAWKCRQREKVAATVKIVVAELDGERRSRRRAERVNAKLGEALAETERSLQAAEMEIMERKRLEKMRDDLVSGGGASAMGRVEVEEMRREAEMAQEELDKEREMLRLADELREERVQMKLLEARLQFEEKNAAVEQLRGELEAILETTKKDPDELPAPDEHHPTDHDRFYLPPPASQGANGDVAASKTSEGEDDDDDEGGVAGGDSEGSDLHSIELNVQHGNRKGCKWSHAAASKEKTTTTTTSKNAASSSFSASDRGTDHCAADPWSAGAAFDRPSPEESEGYGGCSDRSSRYLDEDSERYEAIKNLREQMLVGHGFFFMSQSQADDRGYEETENHRYGLL